MLVLLFRNRYSSSRSLYELRMSSDLQLHRMPEYNIIVVLISIGASRFHFDEHGIIRFPDIVAIVV